VEEWFSDRARESGLDDRLKLLTQIAEAAPGRVLAIGKSVPDFRLIDQKRRPVALSDLRGNVVAVNYQFTAGQLADLDAGRPRFKQPNPSKERPVVSQFSLTCLRHETSLPDLEAQLQSQPSQPCRPRA
jgi:hypothetical protein